MRGVLYLVVGPSGVGKDSILGEVRRALAADPMVVFPRRSITRPADPDGEDHLPMGVEEFALAEAEGAFALSWGAHGLKYGVPVHVEEDLAAGRAVVVNVSRMVIEEARLRLPPVKVVNISASPSVLAARLAARGRETAADIAARLARDVPIAGADVATVMNDGALADAIAAVIAIIRP